MTITIMMMISNGKDGNYNENFECILTAINDKWQCLAVSSEEN